MNNEMPRKNEKHSLGDVIIEIIDINK